MKKKTPYQRTRYRLNAYWAVAGECCGETAIFPSTCSYTRKDAKREFLALYEPGTKWADWEHWKSEGFRVVRIELKEVK